jgi:hypothetical protein
MTQDEFLALVDAWQEKCLADPDSKDLDIMEAQIQSAPWEFTADGNVVKK